MASDNATTKKNIQLAHGGGGQLTAELIADVIIPAISGTEGAGQDIAALDDAALLDITGPAVFTTDSYVVQPLEFPGGDIGKLAVCGTVNDLAVCGARPRWLSLSLVICEGLEISLLKRVLTSAGLAARDAGVAIVTGDTKVVGRDAGDGLIVNTAGVGEMLGGAELGFDKISVGDKIILSGPLGEHGLAIMSMREGLNFSADLESDCASLNELTVALIEELGDKVHFMRDPTRGGLAATLAETATAAGVDIEINAQAVPVNPTARSASELLGLDLLTVANEGKLVAVVDADAANEAKTLLTGYEIASQAAIIGGVVAKSDMPLVEMVTAVGGRRVVQVPYGEELPRIC